MSPDIRKIISKIVTAAVILALTGAVIFYFLIPEYYLPILPWLLLFFTVTTGLIHAWQINLAKKDMARFTRSSMIATMIRLFLYSAVAIAYIATHPKNIVVFIICLVIFYIVFTSIEIIDLTQFLRKRKK